MLGGDLCVYVYEFRDQHCFDREQAGRLLLVNGGKFLNYRERGIIIMTKAELIVAMAKDADITKMASAEALSSFMETVARELKKNGKFGLVGFGSFSVIKRKARKGRNPQTGEEIKIKAKKVIKFKPGKALAEKINR